MICSCEVRFIYLKNDESVVYKFELNNEYVLEKGIWLVIMKWI